jgi:hypothetical protein
VEPIVHINGEWVPSLCCLDDLVGITDARIPNHLYFYTSVIDGKSTAILTGPYNTYEDALNNVESAKELARTGTRQGQEGRTVFMAFGVASSNTLLKTVF